MGDDVAIGESASSPAFHLLTIERCVAQAEAMLAYNAGVTIGIASDPCDGWQRPAHSPGWIYPAERPDPICIEGFEPKTATPVLAQFLTEIRTDWHHWSNDLDWTLESGPDEAPSCVDIVVPYNYSPGCGPCWTSYGGEPGYPPEVETGTPWFIDEDGTRCELNLIEAERERIETWIYENPPEPDYGDDW